MIDSCYWKEELDRIARTISHKKKPARWSERGHGIIERDIMIGFFIVRRLIELRKVSSATRDHALTVYSCPTRGKNVTRLNNHRIMELYTLEKEKRDKKKPLYLSNQFIHAYTSFVVRDDSRNWSDMYVVSDFDRNDYIWRIPISEIHSIFKIAEQDYPHSIRSVYCDKMGDYEVSTN
jgi:hypothetical protein